MEGSLPILPRPSPDCPSLQGSLVQIVRIFSLHDEIGEHLWQNVGRHDYLWHPLPFGPFADKASFLAWMQQRFFVPERRIFSIVKCSRCDPPLFCNTVGLFLLLNISEAMGTVEMGLVFGPHLARTTAATEAFFLLADYVFQELKYRRLVWVCDSENAASIQAAKRFGFVLEGRHRQAYFFKGKNSDALIFSIIDQEWPFIRSRIISWLSPENFGDDGLQKKALSSF